MIEINLLGKTKKTKVKISSAGLGPSSSKVSALIFIAVILIEIVALILYTLHLNNRIEILTQQRNRLRSVEREVRTIKAKLKEVRTMTATIKNLDKGRGEAFKNLKEIADVIPAGLWLVKLTKSGNVLKIEGKSFSTEAVAQYMTNLGNLKNINRVNFDRSGLVRLSGKNGRDIYKFYIQVILKG